MYENDNKIFFWDDVVDSFRLHYDFDEMFQYYSPWASLCASQDTGTATVNIDSVSIYHLGNDSITIQNISISNNGTVNNDIITAVYKGIGLREFGIKLPLGMGLCDFNRAITKLRCFESGDIFYKFVDYSCDSTWFTTSINPVKNHEYVLFPNPTSGIINFNAELVGSKYKVFNITGEFISEGIIKDDYLFVPKTGTFILQLFNKRFYNTYLIIVQM